MNKKFFGFTLAEMLIAMTIIGIVAGMTIPTLRYNTSKKERSAKLKKFYSRMENAVLDMQVDHGSFRNMKHPGSYSANFQWYMTYIDPYMGHKYVDKTNRKIYFEDGTTLSLFFPGGCVDVLYDVNGDKKPNKQGYDQQRFLFCFTDGNRTYWFNNKDIFFGTYGGNINSSTTTRETMIAKCKSSTVYCSRLLQNDHWEYKEDYPFKF